ncbi:MAG: hypothetical protein NTW29_04880 [Bacteroidetes bacterium]|nr:hypothetical protein [Bacteroidota bacterium]
MNKITQSLGTGVLFLLIVLSASCKKSALGDDPQDPSTPYKLSYGDSILYLKSGGANIVYPTVHRDGIYTGFPEGIEIDELTGAINLENSESGLRYRITHVSTKGDTTTTMVVLSGITFKDHFYYLSAGDSIALPIYNSSESRVLPLSGSTFDEGNVANGGGCSVRTDNGKINLKETIRNGVFGFPPRNDAQQTFEIKYRINDNSGKSLNKLKVLLYWYNTLADVPQYVWDILNERTAQGVFLRNNILAPGEGVLTGRPAKPRPPCVIIIAN